MEWGTKAYNIMWRLKELFDPEYVLNPGVVLNKVCLWLPVTTLSQSLVHNCGTQKQCLQKHDMLEAHKELCNSLYGYGARQLKGR